jgi:RhoGAP domain
LDSISEKIPDSPKKERERFRDKVKLKLKFKTKATFEQVAAEAAPKDDDDGLIFGTSIDKVEKDGEHKNVPRIIVECIKVLELESHLTTPGIYRISGNKNTIDALKKKLNEKKSSKKDLKYVNLKEQDVHTLTGLLKMFFRELQPTLMPATVFSQCSPGN